MNNCELTNKFSNQILNLFNWIVPACLNFININNCVKQFYVCDFSLVENLLKLLQITLENILIDIKDDDTKNLQIWLQAGFLQSALWAFGSTLDNCSRTKFDVYYKKLWKGKIKEFCYPSTIDKIEISIPQENTLYDYYYSYKQRGSWKYWQDLLKNEKHFDNVLLFDNECIISTIDTLRYTNLINNHIKYKLPILITGETGTGKSFLMKDILFNKLDKNQYQITNINLSKFLTTNQVQQFILNKLNRTKSGQYITTNKKSTLIVHLDDFNLLASHETHPIIELLRLHIDHNIWYDLNSFEKIYLNNVYFTGCSNLLFNRHEKLCPRFLRHFSIYTINEFSHETVLRIYNNILQNVWKKMVSQLIHIM